MEHGILQSIVGILEDYCKDKRTACIQATSSLRDDLRLDSFDAIDVIWRIESHFDITIDPAIAYDLGTVEDIVRIVSNQLAGGQAS
jgi:acyl carrier protein